MWCLAATSRSGYTPPSSLPLWTCSKRSKELFIILIGPGSNFMSDLELNQQTATDKRGRRSYLVPTVIQPADPACSKAQRLLQQKKNQQKRIAGFKDMYGWGRWKQDKASAYLLAVASWLFNLDTVWDWICGNFCLCGSLVEPAHHRIRLALDVIPESSCSGDWRLSGTVPFSASDTVWCETIALQMAYFPSLLILLPSVSKQYWANFLCLRSLDPPTAFMLFWERREIGSSLTGVLNEE